LRSGAGVPPARFRFTALPPCQKHTGKMPVPPRQASLRDNRKARGDILPTLNIEEPFCFALGQSRRILSHTPSCPKPGGVYFARCFRMFVGFSGGRNPARMPDLDRQDACSTGIRLMQRWNRLPAGGFGHPARNWGGVCFARCFRMFAGFSRGRNPAGMPDLNRQDACSTRLFRGRSYPNASGVRQESERR
jgi:hypothetical protein